MDGRIIITMMIIISGCTSHAVYNLPKVENDRPKAIITVLAPCGLTGLVASNQTLYINGEKTIRLTSCEYTSFYINQGNYIFHIDAMLNISSPTMQQNINLENNYYKMEPIYGGFVFSPITKNIALNMIKNNNIYTYFETDKNIKPDIIGIGIDEK